MPWPARTTLGIGELHLGYADTLSHDGIPSWRLIHSAVEDVEDEDDSVPSWRQARRGNRRTCGLCRLSSETLKMILGFLQDDLADLYCFRQACHRLRILCMDNDARRFPERSYSELDAETQQHMIARFRRDQLCARCLEHCEYNNPENACSAWTKCKFESWTQERLFCMGCRSLHPARAFSPTQRHSPADVRVCIGREGVLRLCEHKSLRWADLEEIRRFGFYRWRGTFDGNCSSCNRGIQVYISDSRLREPGKPRHCMTVSMIWKAQATTTMDSHKRFRENELAAMFQRLHQAAGRFGFAWLRGPASSSAMAMNCFDRPWCTCVSYDDGSEHETEYLRGRSWNPTGVWYPKGCQRCLDSGVVRKHYTQLGESDPSPCKESQALFEDIMTVLPGYGMSSPEDPVQILDVEYERIMLRTDLDVEVLWRDQDEEYELLQPLRPPHKWFHALDPDSYVLADDWDNHGNVWPKCTNSTCRNFYQSYQTSKCPTHAVKLTFARDPIPRV